MSGALSGCIHNDAALAESNSNPIIRALQRELGLRAHLDDRHDTLNYRIRDAELAKVPYMAIVGQREELLANRVIEPRGISPLEVGPPGAAPRSGV